MFHIKKQIKIRVFLSSYINNTFFDKSFIHLLY